MRLIVNRHIINHPKYFARMLEAALAWRRMFPEGNADQNKGGRGKKTDRKTAVSFPTFAKTHFKVGENYATRALSIANASPELLGYTTAAVQRKFRGA